MKSGPLVLPNQRSLREGRLVRLGDAMGRFPAPTPRGREAPAVEGQPRPYASPSWTRALEPAGLRRGPLGKASGSVLGALGPGFLM